MNKENNNLTIKNLVKTEWFNQFDKNQQEEIRLGLENNLNVSIYAKKVFNPIQMEQIRLGLEKNLDVSFYAKTDFDWEEMELIRLALEDNLENERRNK